MTKPVLPGLLATLVLVALIACNLPPAAPQPTPTATIFFTATPTSPVPTQTSQADACPITTPVWVKSLEDAAVKNLPEYGYYFVNQDRSIWMSAWWTGEKEHFLTATKEGIKTGWFRPAGAELEIRGQRINGGAPPLQSHVPCCYPTRFQATGLYFPAPGCWEVIAKADESMLSVIVWVEP